MSGKAERGRRGKGEGDANEAAAAKKLPLAELKMSELMKKAAAIGVPADAVPESCESCASRAG
jgi:hypothetical protein